MLFCSNTLLHTHTHSHLGTAQYNHNPLLLATEQLQWGERTFFSQFKSGDD
uniref:Uncharacterized protein n=1 Tax=Anguilla anguilla TaxID=7936 RepID=A0A0E9RZK6_ANGAN